jgi:hypothetical protein
MPSRATIHRLVSIGMCYAPRATAKGAMVQAFFSLVVFSQSELGVLDRILAIGE